MIEALEAMGETRLVTAAELAVTTKAIQSWTAGRNLPNGAVLIRICRYLGVSADWLLGLSDVREVA